MIMSTSDAASPAQASARDAASVAISIALMWEMRRSFMPVRLVIQSSEVSRNVDRSSLLRTAGGRPSPQPVIAAYRMSGIFARNRKRAGRRSEAGTQNSEVRSEF